MTIRLPIATALVLVLTDPVQAQEPPCRVAQAPWDAERYGNHRAVVQVTDTAVAVHLVLPWRRPDRHPEKKALLVVDGRTGQIVRNVRRGPITQAMGELDFEPTSGPGQYFVYYLPFRSGGRSNYPNVTYLPVDETADPAWLAKLAGPSPRRATPVQFEAVDSLNSFAPMEVIATDSEVAALWEAHRGEPMLVFPEDRLHSIRMKDQLPSRWTSAGPQTRFADQARRGEFLAFQLGIVATQKIDDLRVTFTDLAGPGGARISRDRIASFNQSGVNWDGMPFAKVVSIPAGAVQAIWNGVDVSLGTRPGVYRGAATVTARGVAPKMIGLEITVGRDSVRVGGADEPAKMTRLKWLNSTLGQRNDVVAPYRPIRVEGSVLSVLGRRLALAPSGLPASIETFFTPEMTAFSVAPKAILSAPVRLDLLGVDGGVDAGAVADGVHFFRREPGTVAWTATSRHPDYDLEIRGTLEFDGYLSYQMRLLAKRSFRSADTRLVIPYASSSAKYAMGLGLKGQRRPAVFDWRWDVATKNQDALWLGDVNAGLYFSLRSDNYARPLNTNFYLQKPLNLPPAWGNDGRGSVSWREAGQSVDVWAATGPRTMVAGDSLRFDVVMLITPFHPIDPDYQWSHRFYHRYAPLDTVAATGANVINVHHATEINPYINYPFIAHREMKAYIDSAHRRGLNVKIYNTVRELSNRAPETFALRSLGHEIYSPGQGGGYAWLQEHLGDDYIAAWFVPELKDAAVVNSGMSRWHNYYVEGINWLVQNVGIDGLYLDDVAFDRTTMKRVKRMLLQNGRPGIVDLHSANQYNRNDGFINSAMLYLEHFPYLNRLWFGEYFDYQANSPDFFLTEVSGIPFGLMGEMLEGGGNPWRGLLYGMTNRMPWNEASDPRPIWKVWDDFGIKGSRMIGYWVETVPVKTNRGDVLATVYRQAGRALVVLASWADGPVKVRLVIDWASLGLVAGRATITAPAVAGMQEAGTVGRDDEIEVAPGKGKILILR